MRTRPGEVWLADLGLAAKTRPVLIISREDECPPRALIIHVPMTTQNRGSRYEVDLGKLPFLRKRHAKHLSTGIDMMSGGRDVRADML